MMRECLLRQGYRLNKPGALFSPREGLTCLHRSFQLKKTIVWCQSPGCMCLNLDGIPTEQEELSLGSCSPPVLTSFGLFSQFQRSFVEFSDCSGRTELSGVLMINSEKRKNVPTQLETFYNRIKKFNKIF